MVGIGYNAKYRPFSFEDYMKPALIYDKAYSETMQNLNNLADTASQFSAYIDPQSEAYKTYKGYLDKLSGTADYLQKNGMDLNHNSGMLIGLRNTYRDSIIPINTAAQVRATQAQQKQKLEAQGYVFYNEPSFDDLVMNPTLTGSMYNSNQVYKNAQDMAKALSGRTKLSEQLQHLDKYNMIYRGGTGLTEDHVQLMQSDPQFMRQIDQIMLQNGIDKTKMSDQQYQQALTTALNGAYAGFEYKPENKLLKDDEELAKLDYKYKLKYAQETAGNKKKEENQPGSITTGIALKGDGNALKGDGNASREFRMLKNNEDLMKLITARLVENSNNVQKNYPGTDNSTIGVRRVHRTTHKDDNQLNHPNKSGLNNFSMDNPIRSIGFDPNLGEKDKNGIPEGQFVIVDSDGIHYRLNDDTILGTDLQNTINAYRTEIKKLERQMDKYEDDTNKQLINATINDIINDLLVRLSNDVGFYRPSIAGNTDSTHPNQSMINN